jgi:hypothetical protein
MDIELEAQLLESFFVRAAGNCLKDVLEHSLPPERDIFSMNISLQKQIRLCQICCLRAFFQTKTGLFIIVKKLWYQVSHTFFSLKV